MTLSLATTLQQWALLAGVVLAAGCIAWMLFVANGVVREAPETDLSALRGIERRVATLGAATAAALVVAWLLRGAVQLWTFRDPFVPLSEDVSFLLFDLFWGAVWMGQGAVVVLLLPAFLAARPPLDPAPGDLPRSVAAGRWLTVGLVLALVATLSMSSHAMGVESARSLAVAADGIHLLAAGTWIGSLTVILAVGRSAGRGLFAAQVRAFSPMAVVSVAALVLMGVGLSWAHLQSVSDLWTGTYGRVLSAKVLAAMVVLLAGFWNWRRGLPSLDADEGASRVRRGATLEVAVAMGVLALTAVLVHSAKP